MGGCCSGSVSPGSETYSVFVSSSTGEAVAGSKLSVVAEFSKVVCVSCRISEVGREIGEGIGGSKSTGVGVSSRSPSSESFVSGCLPLSVGDNEEVEGPAVELADDEVGGESLCRQIELRHDRLKSPG